MNEQTLDQIIRQRRSVPPTLYNQKPISKDTILEILNNGNYAPNHKHTEPWRFKIMTGNALQRLSDYLGDYYTTHTPPLEFSQAKLKKIKEKPLQSTCVLAICLKTSGIVPYWEELAALSCAVQNIWLSCTARGIGSYWSTPEAALQADAKVFKLAEGEKCLGLFYMGYCDDASQLSAERGSIVEKITWIED